MPKCILPWISIETTPLGTTRPCCLYTDEIPNVDLKTSTLEDAFNSKTPSGRRRATSFDLVLLRIPQSQNWDSGVGYDYYDYNATIYDDKSYSERPSTDNSLSL